MNPIEQVEAEKLAQDAVSRAEALAILATPRRISKNGWFAALGMGFTGFVFSGAFDWISSGELLKNINYVLISVFAWSGMILAALAYDESRQNRKRLEAALVLLDLKQEV
jgi:hypothetical protein